MRSPPIPRRILPHEALLCDVTFDAWQHPVDTPVARLRHVRIDPDLQRQAGKDDTTHSASMVLFFDCRNSLPARVEFHPGQAVIWRHEGREMRFTVKEIAPIWDAEQLHHYEITLEGG